MASAPAHAEGEGDDPHVLDRRIGEHPFDVAPPVEHEAGEDERAETHGDHERAGGKRIGVGREQNLEAEDGVERDVEEEPRKHRRYRRRAFGMGIGQPGMERGEADLRAVAEKQEKEGDVE